MSFLEFDNVSVAFPIYNSRSQLITSRMLNAASGGRLDSDSKGHVLVQALEEVSFTLGDGDRLGIIGGNGAGKSTLLRAASGIYKPTSGSVRCSGEVTTLIDISLGINLEATGRDNIFLRGSLLGLSRQYIESRFDEIVLFSELGNFIEMPVRTYSSGMQLRLAFAVSTIITPEILIMDEWLSVGDGSFIEKAETRLNNLVDNARILILASHSRDLLENTCNKILWLENGKVRAFGQSSKILSSYF
jgi:lipopolysaccharide transport system ATP-binding protein